MLPTKSVGLSVLDKKLKIYFQDGSHLGYLIWTILAIFDVQVTPMLPIKFQVNRPLGSGEEANNRFSRWRPLLPSWISDQNDFSYFLSTCHLDASYQVSNEFGILVQEKKRKLDFPME